MTLVIVFVVALAVALGVGIWFATHHAGSGRTGTPNQSATATIEKPESTPKPVTEHHGNSPDCPATDCIAMLVNGDLLFHEGLW
ncbi:metallophosphatase, partial [Bifidobacterium callitrichidarum]